MKENASLFGAARRRFICVLLLTVAFCAARDSLAASVGPAGYTNSFAALPPAADWATLNIAGGGGDTYDLDTDVNAVITSSGVTAQTTLSTSDPPSASGTATWSSLGLYLQTRPTQNRYTVLMGKFVNNTGTNATQARLSYVMTFSGPTAPEEKGTRVYYSLTGTANSWINLPALNSTANTGSYPLSTNVLLNWTNGGALYVLFADDNANSGTDEGCQFDNFSLRVTAGSPPGFSCRLNTPTNGAVFVSGAAIGAQAVPLNGTPPYTVEYFTNAGAGNLTFASAGVVGAPPYIHFLETVPAGTYNIFAVATDSTGIPSSKNSGTNTFRVADPICFVMTAPTNDAIFTHTSNVFGNATVAGGTTPYSVQFYLDNLPGGAAVISPPYQHNFGGLPVGDHTVRATVTDARGWVSNSLVHTVHITGPLAANLAPTNGSAITFGAAVSLTATVAGGEAPYAAEFYVNGQVADSLSSPPFTVDLGMLPVGSYTCYVHATDSSVPAQQASSSTNRITILPPPLRVMPLGDSITYGAGAAGGYRAPLYQLLTNSGYNVDFIGTQTGNGTASLPDPNHEGYPGFTISDVDSRLPIIFGAVTQPDIILLLLGVNDYLQNEDLAQVTNRFEALVVRLATNWSNAKIIVASLTEVSEPRNTQIQTTFNIFLPGICERQRQLGRMVFFTDMHSAVPLADMPDQLHPNQLGYTKMATNWFSAIHLFSCATCPPRFISHPKSQSMLPGTNVSLTAEAIGAGDPIQYQWRFEGTNILNATNATYNFSNASIIHQGNYTVVATNTNGTAVSSNAFLFLFLRPGFVLNPVAQTVLQGGTATFTGIATGAPPIWYRWLSNGLGIVTNNTGVLVISNVQSSYTIRLTATNLASGPGGVNMTPFSGVLLTMMPDFDGDHMADAWEAQYGFDTNSMADAALDFDGDGLSNRAEYVAGTNPTNALSLLELKWSATNIAAIEFLAQPNITYEVQYRTNLTSAIWSSFTNISAQAQAQTMTVTLPSPPAAGERYYRVVTPPFP
jgi:lysophospholipase L1-like esterase